MMNTCLGKVDVREGVDVHRDWFSVPRLHDEIVGRTLFTLAKDCLKVDHLRLFAEAEDDMDFVPCLKI